MDALELLSGDAHTFTEKVWASRVHLHHADAARLVPLLDLGGVDRLLTASALRTPTVRVVQDGVVLPSSCFTRPATLSGAPMTGLVDAAKVLALFEAGATVALQGLHRYWPPLTALVRDLELALGHPCQANAYLTPPGAQGFARHSDTHDVFVFQTHGSKQWTVEDADEDREVVLVPGLSMYLPTGTPHSARSQVDTSLHVTVGINRSTWRQVLEREVARLLADEQYDAPLPAGWPADPARFAAELGPRLSALATSLMGQEPTARAEQLADEFHTGRTPALDGGLLDLVALPRLSDGTRLERRPTAACVLRERGDRLSVLLGDRELRMPARLAEPMAFVRDHAAFEVRDLAPWLDPGSRLVICRRLVREGLLRVAQAHSGA